MPHKEASPELTQRGRATYATVLGRTSFAGNQRAYIPNGVPCLVQILSKKIATCHILLQNQLDLV